MVFDNIGYSLFVIAKGGGLLVYPGKVPARVLKIVTVAWYEGSGRT